MENVSHILPPCLCPSVLHFLPSNSSYPAHATPATQHSTTSLLDCQGTADTALPTHPKNPVTSSLEVAKKQVQGTGHSGEPGRCCSAGRPAEQHCEAASVSSPMKSRRRAQGQTKPGQASNPAVGSRRRATVQAGESPVHGPGCQALLHDCRLSPPLPATLPWAAPPGHSTHPPWQQQMSGCPPPRPGAAPTPKAP